ncbi:MAG TPA: rod shape-determining protein RodA [Caulobacteraceae bacterium]
MTVSALTRPGERDRLVVKFGQMDWTLALAVSLIAVVGGVMLFSIAGSNWDPWAARHLIRYALCFALMVALAMCDLRIWFTMAYPVYALGLLLLLAVALVGDVSMGAQRWLQLGPVRIQPSEIMKIGVVLAIARFYHALPPQYARLSWRLLIPGAMIAVPVALVAHQPDLGTSLLILFTGFAMMVLAGLSWRLIGLGALGAAVTAPIMYFFVLHDYQRKRVDVLFNPEADPSGAGYHILQSKIALGSGGLLGKGYGLGTQSQLNFLPEKQTDFIFATIAEEFGFAGSFFVLFLYGSIIFMALRIASTTHSHFGRLGAAGVTATFALYVMINGAMVMGLAPVVGVPMPLLSYGGTVMLTVMIGFGLVQSARVHRYSEVTSGKGALL